MKVLSSNEITLYCYGEQELDINHVINVCEVFKLVIEHDFKGIIRVGHGKPVKLKEIVETTIKYSGRSIKLNLTECRSGESYENISRYL